MSASVLFYAPDVDGYQETLTYARSFFTSDSGQDDIINKQNMFNESGLRYVPYPKYTVSAQYTFFKEKDVVIFESLMKEAKETFIYMPLWFSLMQLDGAYTSGSSVSIPVEAPEGNPWNALSTTNYLHFTAWADGYFSGSATSARDVYTTFIRFDNSDKYTYNHITFPYVSAVDLTNEELDFGSAPAFNGNDKDLVAPVIRVNVIGSDFSYSLSNPEAMTATVQMVEL